MGQTINVDMSKIAAKQRFGRQGTRFKKARPIILFIAVALFVCFAYGIVTDDTGQSFMKRELKRNDSLAGNLKSDNDQKSSAEIQPENVISSMVVESTSNYDAASPVCRKPLRSLWLSPVRQDPVKALWENIENNSSSPSLPACSKVFDAMKRGLKVEEHFSNLKNWSVLIQHNETSLLDILGNCEEMRRYIDFPDKPASQEEAEFPLAYVFMLYKNLAQTVRLFRMIYQPQNAYCINYDTKSDEDYKRGVISMGKCFPNVYFLPKPEAIHYGHYSVLHSDMECLKVLNNSPIKWRYVQITSWNCFPLKTNWEMVKIFKALNGSQDAELTENNDPTFTLYEAADGRLGHTDVKRPVPPDGITTYKGSLATSMTREFIQWMFTDPVSIRFYQYYYNHSIFPDEFYWMSLIHNTQLNAPGRFPGQCLIYYDFHGVYKPFISRYQVWEIRQDAKGGKLCGGWFFRGSCMFGVSDLVRLTKRTELFAHKLYEDYEPALLYCLEEWYWQRVCMGQTDLNITYYENIPSVRYHDLSAAEKEIFDCSF